jgi:hypothetical protein
VTDDINNEMGAGSTDDQKPASGGFLSQDEIEQRVAAFRASLLKLDQDSAEAARIDMLIAGANAMFGDDLTPFEDPPVAGPDHDGLRQQEQAAASGAPPRIEVNCSGPGHSLVINGDHAEPHIHVSANQADEEVRRLTEEVAKLQQAVAPRRTRARKRPGRKAPRTRRLGPSAPAMLGAVAGVVPILVHSAVVVQVIAITILAALPVFWLVAIAAAIFSGRSERRRAAFDILRLLMDRDLRQEDPPSAVRRETPMVSSERDAERAGL